jgi:hypothetical protein
MPESEGLPDLAGQVRPLIQMLPVAVQPRRMATLVTRFSPAPSSKSAAPGFSKQS